MIELLVATATASVLMVGLSSALFVSSRALDLDAASDARTRQAIGRIAADARTANRFRTLSATAVEFDAPDRDADGVPETLRYEWSGVAGDPLTRRLNGGAPVALIDDVTSVDFQWATRAVTALDVTAIPAPDWPVYEEASAVASTTSQATQLNIATPTGAASGDLLVAFLAIEYGHPTGITAGTSWTQIGALSNGSAVTLAAYWKNATASEPVNHGWTWTGSSHALGWIVRVSNHDATAPVAVWVTGVGSSQFPSAPAIANTLDNCLVLRAGAFQGAAINAGQTGLIGHTGVLMEQAGGAVSGGCGYRVWKPAGLVKESLFTLTSSSQYRTLTVVVAPADPNG